MARMETASKSPLECLRPGTTPDPLGRFGTLCAAAGRTRDAVEIGSIFQDIAGGLTHTVPTPGSGRTLARWRVLADIAASSLPLVKLVEGHLDAVAILHELNLWSEVQPRDIWAVWCAEPPGMRVAAVIDDTEVPCRARVSGIKPWCSGAASVTRALVSVWNPRGQPCLAAVDMDAPGVRLGEGWHAVGMGPTASVDVEFDNVPAVLIGEPGAYVQRPGFLHGAAGVAACWYGACAAIAEAVRRGARRRPDDAHALAHLGAIDIKLAQAASQMRSCAAAIDADPGQPHARAVWRARLAVEDAAQAVLERAPRALGPSPFCKDPSLAGLLADLPIYLRQSHGERDLAAHGRALIEATETAPWTL